ncbi:hypothetical protein ACA910_022280 [Epithemia clementina (nom. ined.)]
MLRSSRLFFYYDYIVHRGRLVRLSTSTIPAEWTFSTKNCISFQVIREASPCRKALRNSFSTGTTGEGHGNDNQNHLSYSYRSATVELDSDALELLINAEMTILRALSKSGAKDKTKIAQLVTGVVDMYSRWWTLLQEAPDGRIGKMRKAKNSLIFEMVLEACSHHDRRAKQAITIIENYDEIFGANIEFQPERKHYEQLLLAHTDEKAENSAAVASEVIQLLETWSFTMKPVMETYFLACRCVSKHIIHSGNMFSQDELESLSSNLSSFISKAFPFLDNKMRRSMEDNEMIDTFLSLSESIIALSKISGQHNSLTQMYPVAEQAMEYWLKIIFDDRLPQLCQKEDLKFVDMIETTARNVLKIYEANMSVEDCKSVFDLFLQQIEPLLGRKLLSVESNPLQSTAIVGEGVQMPSEVMQDLSDDSFLAIDYDDESDIAMDGETDQLKLSTCIEKEKIMHKITQQLFDVPTGKMTPEQWGNAQDAMQWWFRQRSEKSVLNYLNLFERVANEVKTKNVDTENISMLLNASTMASILEKWYSVWREKHTSWTPTRLAYTLDRLAQGAPEIKVWELNQQIINFLMNALLLRSNPSEAAESMYDLLNHFLDNNSGPSDPHVFVYFVNGVLDIWSKSGRSDAAERAHSIVMKAKASSIGPYLDIITYNAMLNVYAECGHAAEAESLFLALVDDWKKDPRNPKPNNISFQTAAWAWVRSGQEQAPERATDLFRRLATSSDLTLLRILPETRIFNNILASWAKSGRVDAAEQAHRLLADMKTHGLDIVRPDHVSYSIVVGALAKAGNPEMAEKVLVELCQLYDHNVTSDLRPNIGMFANVLDAWSRSHHPDRVQHMRDVFNLSQHLHDEHTIVKGGNSEAFDRMHNLMLHSIVSSDAEDRAKQGDYFLQWMKSQWQADHSKFKPDGRSYTHVIGAYLALPSGLERAEELLYEAFMDDSVSLQIRTPARVILALAKANKARAADAWLHRIFDACFEGDFKGEAPSASLIGGVLASWFRASKTFTEAGTRAKALMQRFVEMKRKGISSEILDAKAVRLLPLICLRAATDEEGIDSGYEIVQSLQRQSGEWGVHVKPDVSMYNEAIRAYVELDEPKAEKAEMVLRDMLRNFMNDNQQAKPDVECFNNGLKGWANTKNESRLHAFERADLLLSEMNNLSQYQELQLRPNRFSYHFVMSLCADRGSAQQMAEYFDQMKNQFLQTNDLAVKPSAISYKYIIQKLCEEGMPDTADAYLRAACREYQNQNMEKPPKQLFHYVMNAWKKKRDNPSKNGMPESIGEDWISRHGARPSLLPNIMAPTTWFETSPDRHNATVDERIQDLLSLQGEIMPAT